MTEISTIYTCQKCSQSLSQNEKQCSVCGGKPHVTVSIIENVKHYSKLKGKVKNSVLPSKKKLRQEFTVGDDLYKATGKYNYLERYINKDSDTYIEKITTSDGVVVKDIKEKLSDHKGHGSAKTKN